MFVTKNLLLKIFLQKFRKVLSGLNSKKSDFVLIKVIRFLLNNLKLKV